MITISHSFVTNSSTTVFYVTLETQEEVSEFLKRFKPVQEAYFSATGCPCAICNFEPYLAEDVIVEYDSWLKAYKVKIAGIFNDDDDRCREAFDKLFWFIMDVAKQFGGPNFFEYFRKLPMGTETN